MSILHGRYARMYRTIGAVSVVVLTLLIAGEIDTRLWGDRGELFEIPAAPDFRAEVAAPTVRRLQADYPPIDVPDLRPATLGAERVFIPARPSVVVTPEPPDQSVLVEELPLIDVPDLRPPVPEL